MASQQILGFSCADSGNALLLSEGSFCCLVSLCYLPLSPICSLAPAPPLGRLINARPRFHLGTLEMQSAPPLGRFRSAKPRLRLGALEMQGCASSWAPPKCKHAPLSPWTSPRVAKDRWSHPGTLVTCPGVPKPQGGLYACVLVAPRNLVRKSHCHVFLGGLDPGQAPLKTLLLMLRQT